MHCAAGAARARARCVHASHRDGCIDYYARTRAIAASSATAPPIVVVVDMKVIVFGAAVGLMGALYNHTVVGFMMVASHLRRIPATVRAGAIGAVVGLLLYIDPLTAGGGDALTTLLLAGKDFALPVAFAYLVIRFLVGPLSYAAGTPGGLFAPLLALGALSPPRLFLEVHTCSLTRELGRLGLGVLCRTQGGVLQLQH